MDILEAAERVERILAASPLEAANQRSGPQVSTAARVALAVAIHDAYEKGRADGAREPLPLLPQWN